MNDEWLEILINCKDNVLSRLNLSFDKIFNGVTGLSEENRKIIFVEFQAERHVDVTGLEEI